jgi:predicted glycosyltransferase
LISAIKIWIDVRSPRDALFAKSLERRRKDARLVFTTANNVALSKFCSRIGLEHLRVGPKARSWSDLSSPEYVVERENSLLKFTGKTRGLDCSISFLSSEAARVSFGLALPHYVVTDSPQSYELCKLCLPLASKIFTPYMISLDTWSIFGKKGGEVLRFRSTEPWAWLNGGLLTGGVKKEARARKILILADEILPLLLQNSLEELVRTIRAASKEDEEIVISTSSNELQQTFATLTGARFEDSSQAFFSIPYSSLVIGGTEDAVQTAALHGVPNISLSIAPPAVFQRFYYPKELSQRASCAEDLIKKARKMLQDVESEKSKQRKRAAKATVNFEDPAKFVLNKILADRE